MLICSASLSSTTSRRLRRGVRVFLDARQRGFDALGGRRLGHEGERAARQRVLAVLVERDDLHRNVPGQRILLELAQHRPAQHVGQEHVERHRGRLELLGEVERIGAAHRDQHLEALVAGEVHDHARIVRIVLDDQQDGDRRARSRAGRRGSARSAARRAATASAAARWRSALRRRRSALRTRSTARHTCSGR